MRTTVIRGRASGGRLVAPVLGAGRRLARWSPSALVLTLLVGLAVTIWAPYLAPEVGTGLVEQLTAMAAASGVRLPELSAPAAAALVLLLAAGAFRLVLAVGRTSGRRRGPTSAPARTGAVGRGYRTASASRTGTRVRTVGCFLAAAVPVAVLALLVASGGDRPVPTAGEAALAGAVGLPPGSPPGPTSWLDRVAVPQVAVPQIAAVGSLLSVLGPAPGFDAARAALLAVSLLGCLLLWSVARRISLAAPAAALAVVLGGLLALLLLRTSGAAGSVQPGALAALWLTIGAALAGRSRGATIAAGGAALIASATAPLAAVGLLVFAAHGLLARTFLVTWSRRATRILGGLLAAAAALVAVLSTGIWPDTGGAWTGSGRGSADAAGLLGVGAVGGVLLVLAWYRAPWMRPAVSAGAAALLCAAVPGPHATTALLLAVPVLALLGAAVVDAITDADVPAPAVLAAR